MVNMISRMIPLLLWLVLVVATGLSHAAALSREEVRDLIHLDTKLIHRTYTRREMARYSDTLLKP